MRQFIRQWNQLFMRNRILYSKNKIQQVNCPYTNTMQLVLPEAFRKQALQCSYDDLDHLRIEQTIDLLRDHFYRPGLLNDVTKHIKQCERCLKFKELPEKAPIEKHRCILSNGIRLCGLYDNWDEQGWQRCSHFSDNQPFYMLWTSYSHYFTDSKIYSPKSIGEMHCPLWASWEKS